MAWQQQATTKNRRFLNMLCSSQINKIIQCIFTKDAKSKSQIGNF